MIKRSKIYIWVYVYILNVCVFRYMSTCLCIYIERKTKTYYTLHPTFGPQISHLKSENKKFLTKNYYLITDLLGSLI